MYQSRQIKKLLSVGDVVYSAQGGHEMVIKKNTNNTRTTLRSKVATTSNVLHGEIDNRMSCDEVRKLYFLTKYGYVKSKEARTCTTSR